MKGQPFIQRLGFALTGLQVALRREPSFRFHLVAVAGVLIVLALVRPAPVWWAIGILAIALVLIAELLNSALESLADRLHPEQHPEIRVAKDLAAAAVLVASAAAALVGVIFVLR